MIFETSHRPPRKPQKLSKLSKSDLLSLTNPGEFLGPNTYRGFGEKIFRQRKKFSILKLCVGDAEGSTGSKRTFLAKEIFLFPSEEFFIAVGFFLEGKNFFLLN